MTDIGTTFKPFADQLATGWSRLHCRAHLFRTEGDLSFSAQGLLDLSWSPLGGSGTPIMSFWHWAHLSGDLNDQFEQMPPYTIPSDPYPLTPMQIDVQYSANMLTGSTGSMGKIIVNVPSAGVSLEYGPDDLSDLNWPGIMQGVLWYEHGYDYLWLEFHTSSLFRVDIDRIKFFANRFAESVEQARSREPAGVGVQVRSR